MKNSFDNSKYIFFHLQPYRTNNKKRIILIDCGNNKIVLNSIKRYNPIDKIYEYYII